MFFYNFIILSDRPKLLHFNPKNLHTLFEEMKKLSNLSFFFLMNYKIILL